MYTLPRHNVKPELAIAIGLSPDIAILISIGQIQALVFPDDIKYRGLTFIHAAAVDRDNIEEVTASLLEMGAQPDQIETILELDSIVAHCQIKDVEEIVDRSTWEERADSYRLSGDFDALVDILGKPSIFIYYLEDVVEIEDPVNGFGLRAGEILDAPNIKEIYAFQEAVKRSANQKSVNCPTA